MHSKGFSPLQTNLILHNVCSNYFILANRSYWLTYYFIRSYWITVHVFENNNLIVTIQKLNDYLGK